MTPEIKHCPHLPFPQYSLKTEISRIPCNIFLLEEKKLGFLSVCRSRFCLFIGSRGGKASRIAKWKSEVWNQTPFDFGEWRQPRCSESPSKASPRAAPDRSLERDGGSTTAMMTVSQRDKDRARPSERYHRGEWRFSSAGDPRPFPRVSLSQGDEAVIQAFAQTDSSYSQKPQKIFFKNQNTVHKHLWADYIGFRRRSGQRAAHMSAETSRCWS